MSDRGQTAADGDLSHSIFMKCVCVCELGERERILQAAVDWLRRALRRTLSQRPVRIVNSFAHRWRRHERAPPLHLAEAKALENRGTGRGFLSQPLSVCVCRLTSSWPPWDVPVYDAVFAPGRRPPRKLLPLCPGLRGETRSVRRPSGRSGGGRPWR